MILMTTTTRDDDGGELYRVTNDNLLRVIADFVPYGKLQQQPLTMARTTSAKTPPQTSTSHVAVPIMRVAVFDAGSSITKCYAISDGGRTATRNDVRGPDVGYAVAALSPPIPTDGKR